jgi:hypothetical protein
MNKQEVGQLFDEVVFYFPAFRSFVEADLAGCISRWHRILKDTPLDYAVQQLETYVANREKYYPHPGLLAKTSTDADRYHESMKESGQITIAQWEDMRNKAVGPTEEQRRRVRELLGKTD